MIRSVVSFSLVRVLLALMVVCGLAACSGGGGSGAAGNPPGRDPGGGDPDPDTPDRPRDVIGLQSYLSSSEQAGAYFSPAVMGPRYVALVVENRSTKTNFGATSFTLSLESAAKSAAAPYVIEENTSLYPAGMNPCGKPGVAGVTFGLGQKEKCLVLVRTNDVGAADNGNPLGELNVGEEAKATVVLKSSSDDLDKRVVLTARKLMYMGGAFTQLTDNRYPNPADPIDAAGLVSWNQVEWLSTTVPSLDDASSPVLVTTTDHLGNLYAVRTTSIGLVENREEFISSLIRWNGGRWDTLLSGVEGGIHALATDDAGNLYVGGGFTTIGGQPIKSLAVYTPTSPTEGTWSAVKGATFGPDVRKVYGYDPTVIDPTFIAPAVTALTFVSKSKFPLLADDHPYLGQLLVGGQFTQVVVGGNAYDAIAAVYNPNGGTWVALPFATQQNENNPPADLGTGFCATHRSEVLTFLPTSTGDTFVGGHFWVEDLNTRVEGVTRACHLRTTEGPVEVAAVDPTPAYLMPDLVISHMAVVTKAAAFEQNPTLAPAANGVFNTETFEGVSFNDPASPALSHTSGVFALTERLDTRPVSGGPGEETFSAVYVAGGFNYDTAPYSRGFSRVRACDADPAGNILYGDGLAGKDYLTLGSFFVLRPPTALELRDMSYFCPTTNFVADRIINGCPTNDAACGVDEGRLLQNEAVLTLADRAGVDLAGGSDQIVGSGINLFYGGAFASNMNYLQDVRRASVLGGDSPYDWDLVSPLNLEALVFGSPALVPETCASASNACRMGRLTPMVKVDHGLGEGAEFDLVRHNSQDIPLRSPNNTVWSMVLWLGIEKAEAPEGSVE